MDVKPLIRLLLVMLFLLSAGVAGADTWTYPKLISEPTTTTVVWTGRQPLSRGRVLVWRTADHSMVLQVNRGKKPLWRLRTQLLPGLSALRYQAHTDNLLILRGFCRRQPTSAVGDVSMALSLLDGVPVWTSEPIVSTREVPGQPNIKQGDRIYETYLSPALDPIVVSRRLSDGGIIFWRDIPNPDGQPFDLIGRHIDRMQVQSGGLRVSLVDKYRNWQNYLFSLRDGTLLSSSQEVPSPPTPASAAQLKRSGKKRLWISPGKSTSGLKSVNSSNN